MPLENPLVFYTRHWGGQVVTYARILAMFAKIHLWTRGLERDPNAKNYTDEAVVGQFECGGRMRRPFKIRRDAFRRRLYRA